MSESHLKINPSMLIQSFRRNATLSYSESPWILKGIKITYLQYNPANCYEQKVTRFYCTSAKIDKNKNVYLLNDDIFRGRSFAQNKYAI